MKTRFSLTIITMLGLAVFFTSPAYSQIVYVDIDAIQTPDGMSWETAYTSIQAAMDATTPPAEIWVASGIYNQLAETAIVEINGEFQIYGGFNGTESVREDRNPSLNTTIIDGGISYPCVTIATPATLDGFTIQNGYSSGLDGAGIAVMSTGATIANCIIYNNESMSNGGGLYTNNVDCTIQNCVFKSNKAQLGAAISSVYAVKAFGATLTAINCIFIDNNAYTSGVILNDNVFTDFVHCTFYNNQSSTGSLFQFEIEGQLALTNCIITDHAIPLFNTGHSAVITAEYTRTGEFLSGTGNTQADPLLVDPWNGNYTLGWDSPCRDAAPVDDRATTDILGLERPQGDLADMGAYELIQTGTIALLGSDPIYLECPEEFIDPGAEAFNDDLSPLEVTGAGEVLTSTPGEYTVTYSATSTEAPH